MQNWTDITGIISNISVAGAAFVASYCAVVGLSTWRSELRGRTEYDLAGRLLIGVYGLRDAIAHVRRPNMGPEEYEDRPGREGDVKDPALEDFAYAYSRRWEKITEAKALLQNDRREAEALRGDALGEATKRLDGCVRELHLNVWRHIDRRQRASAARGVPEFEAKMNQVERVVFSGSAKDRFLKAVHQAIGEFEKCLRPHLKK